MTNEELNQGVAELEGIPLVAVPGGWGRADRQTEMHGHGECFHPLYNPAESWADCGPLVEKYRLDMLCEGEDALHGAWSCVTNEGRNTQCTQADTPQQAICLAVIALHQNKGVAGHEKG